MDDGLFSEQGEAIARCWWCQGDQEYLRYHDEEWGKPELRDHTLFEKICLEGFQAGLSWLTILRKRPAFREVFLDFDPERVAEFGDDDVQRLLEDARIVRHKGKIKSTINNAQRALELREEFGSLAAYFWQYEPPAQERPTVMDLEHLKTLASTTTSTALSRDLKRRGWSFVGPTTAYAFMQAMGLVNDHLEGCHRRRPLLQARQHIEIPTPPSTGAP